MRAFFKIIFLCVAALALLIAPQSSLAQTVENPLAITVRVISLPLAPSGLSATAISSSQIDLSWTNNASNQTGFSVEKKTGASGTYSQIDSAGASAISYSATALSAGTGYYFRVRAYNDDGYSDYSNEANATTQSAPPVSSGGGGGGGGSGPASIPITTNISFSGRAYPRSIVTLLKDAQVAASTVAGDDANFSVSVSGLAGGSYLFSLYSEDKKSTRSSLLTFPVSVTAGAATNVSGIFIAPTTALDKSEVKKGDNVAIFGQSYPASDITIAVGSEEEQFFKTKADAGGAYLFTLDTSLLELGQHYAKSKSAEGGLVSSFSTAVGFIVGNKNVAVTPKAEKGDISGDKKVNLIDFSIMAYWYQRPNPPAKVDMNRDGKVNLVDLSILAFYWTG